MSSFKTQNKKLQPGTVLIGENGLPVDTVATIAGSYQLIVNNTDALIYSGGTVTVPASIDLTPVRYHKARYTGRLILETKDKAVYFIDRVSVDNATHTFIISFQVDTPTYPTSIDLSPGWIIAEAEIVNRLATTSSAKIDSIEFRDMQFQIDLDGDPVTIQGANGNTLVVNPDGSINIGGVVNVDVDLTSVENKLDALIGEAESANATLDSIAASNGATQISTASIDTKLTQTNLKLDSVNNNLDSIELKLDDVNNNLSNIEADTSDIVDQAVISNTLLTDIDSNIDQVNTNLTSIEDVAADILAQVTLSNTELSEANAHLQAIENALSAPLEISQPVITAGTSDGTPTGPVFVHVNNIKGQILAAADRDQEFVYADFGTKDQRIIQINYTSLTFSGVTARKTLAYVLDGNRYRRTNITWEIV